MLPPKRIELKSSSLNVPSSSTGTQVAAVIDKDCGAPAAPLGEFAFHLRKESGFC
jgi:hypothetical protein